MQVTRAVKVEYVTKEFRIAVQKVLVGFVVVEELFLDGAEQRLRIFFEGRAPTLELVTAYVYGNFFVYALLYLFERRRWQRIFFVYENRIYN